MVSLYINIFFSHEIYTKLGGERIKKIQNELTTPITEVEIRHNNLQQKPFIVYVNDMDEVDVGIRLDRENAMQLVVEKILRKWLGK